LVFPHFKNQRVQSFAYPADGAVLFRQIGALVKVVGMREDLLRLLKTDPALGGSPLTVCFSAHRSGSAFQYNCYTTVLSAVDSSVFGLLCAAGLPPTIPPYIRVPSERHTTLKEI
jgi:hypothetical protein